MSEHEDELVEPELQSEGETSEDGTLDEEPGELVDEDVVEPELGLAPELAAPSDRQLKAIERAHSTHERKLREIMGEAFGLFVTCPTCEGASIVLDASAGAEQFPPMPGVMECPTCAGEGGRPCEACAGTGAHRFPTKVEGQVVQDCGTCAGRGRILCVDCAGNGWKREAPAPIDLVAGAPPPVTLGPTGQPQAPPGYVLVPVAPDYGAPAPPAPPAPVPAGSAT